MSKDSIFMPLGTIRTFEYDDVISFCEVQKQWGEFSNMSNAFHVEYNGVVYPTSEHLYIAGRFTDTSIIKEITEYPNAMYCKRKFRNHVYKAFERRDWLDINVEWMKFVLNLKYEQNPAFRHLLSDTGDKIILEDSTMQVGVNPYGGHSSFFWGAKDLSKKESIDMARKELRKQLQDEGLSKFQIKQHCKSLKDRLYPTLNSVFIGGNVMGLLLTQLRDKGSLTSCFH